MKVVITGALGHIGSRLIHEIPKFFKHPEIILIDNFSTQRYVSLFNLPSAANISFFELDTTKCDLKSIFEGAHVAIHLAAITDAVSSFSNSRLVEENNLNSTARVAEACIANKTRMIHLSSTSVYGSQDAVVDENCAESELRPQSPYAETKLKEERLIRQLVCSQGLRATTFRFGTIFGTSAGMRFHTAINKFCLQASMDQPLTVWKTALDQKRPYLYISDAVMAIEHIIKNDLFDGTLYNVVTKNSTVSEIIEIIRLQIDNLKINFVDSPIMNQLSYDVDDTRFRNTGFEPHGTLKKGIVETLQLLAHS